MSGVLSERVATDKAAELESQQAGVRDRGRRRRGRGFQCVGRLSRGDVQGRNGATLFGRRAEVDPTLRVGFVEHQRGRAFRDRID